MDQGVPHVVLAHPTGRGVAAAAAATAEAVRHPPRSPDPLHSTPLADRDAMTRERRKRWEKEVKNEGAERDGKRPPGFSLIFTVSYRPSLVDSTGPTFWLAHTSLASGSPRLM